LKLTLHVLVIAVPMHVFPTVLIDPTFVESQYTSKTPWQTVLDEYVLMPTCPMHAVVPPQMKYCPTA
jgi:hypothetical protein